MKTWDRVTKTLALGKGREIQAVELGDILARYVPHVHIQTEIGSMLAILAGDAIVVRLIDHLDTRPGWNIWLSHHVFGFGSSATARDVFSRLARLEEQQ